MAKEEDRKLISEERTDTVIHNKTGQEELRLEFIKREYEEGDTEYYETIAENIECSDGTVISPVHLTRPPNQGGVMLQRCSVCQRESRRSRNANSFSPSSKMHSCFHCRARLCEKHTHIFNNHIVCARCRRRQFIIHRLLSPIFFRRVKGT